MIVKLLQRIGVALFAFGAAVAVAAPAQAAPAAPAAGVAPAAVIYDCGYRADHALYLYRTPNSTTADFWVAKGTTMYAPGCDINTGRSYTQCGGGQHWVKIAGAKHGWAPLSCTTRVYRVVR